MEGDETFLGSFRCATASVAWEVEVERWIRNESDHWVTDATFADMDRRLLLLFEPSGSIAGVVAHELKDAIQPGTEESFFVRLVTAIAVSSAWQSNSIPRNGKVSDVLLATALSDIATRPPAVPFISALIHIDNVRSSNLFTRHGFHAFPPHVNGYLRHTLSNQLKTNHVTAISMMKDQPPETAV